MTRLVVLLTILGVFLAVGTARTSTRHQPETIGGRTIHQWHKLAVVRRVERDKARNRAGVAVRHGRALQRLLWAYSVPSQSAVNIAHREAVRLRLTHGEWLCGVALISRENDNTPANWNPLRYNEGGSDAYGLPQALPGSKMGSAGADWSWNPATQFRWFVAYSKSRYGGVCEADTYQRNHGSY